MDPASVLQDGKSSGDDTDGRTTNNVNVLNATVTYTLGNG